MIKQPTQQFPHEACLAHAPLCRRRRAGSVPNPLLKRFELNLTVEEPISLDPVSSALSQQICCQHFRWETGLSWESLQVGMADAAN